jgi:hypothetical protein
MHRYIDLALGLSKGRGRFLNFSAAPALGKNIFLFLSFFLSFSIWSTFSCLSLVREAGPSHWLKKLQILRHLF